MLWFEIRPETFILGGSFTAVGSILANNIAKWNGTSWSSLGTGMNSWGIVITLGTDTADNLYAGGQFTTVDNVVRPDVAIWLKLKSAWL